MLRIFAGSIEPSIPTSQFAYQFIRPPITGLVKYAIETICETVIGEVFIFPRRPATLQPFGQVRHQRERYQGMDP